MGDSGKFLGGASELGRYAVCANCYIGGKFEAQKSCEIQIICVIRQEN
jgi:hypothetical protein